MKKQFNNESEIKINGLNIEDWIDNPPRSDGDEISDAPIMYDKKLVAYLDLLGITKKIRELVNGQERTIIEKMEKIKGIIESEVKGIPNNESINMLYISDTFIFVCDETLLESLLQLLSIMQTRVLVECKTMLRGAVEFGDVIIRDEGRQIIGPAYIDAYIKQEKHAIFPRIIISKSVDKMINQLPGCYENLVISSDRETSLDYIGVYLQLENKKVSEMTITLRREGLFDILIDEYQKYDELDDSSVRAKYAWTINYLIEKGVWPNGEKYNCW